MSHTPGPWGLLQARTYINVKGASREQICQVHMQRPEDARLIAAAPELLAALRVYMAEFGQGLEAHGIPFSASQAAADEYARAAIAKAEGVT